MKNKLLNNNIYKNIKNIGFTIVELMVVVGIMSVISTLLLFNSSNLNSSVLLSNTAYEIGLIIRDAQVAGLGAKVIATNGDQTVATTSNQGVFFDKLNPQQIVFFADLNKNNTYDQISNEKSQVYIIENKAGKVLNICKLELNNNCTNPNTSENLSIIFKRPNPEAYFYPKDMTNPLGYQGNIAINIGFDDGECRSITIYKTGGIQIDKNFCPTL